MHGIGRPTHFQHPHTSLPLGIPMFCGEVAQRAQGEVRSIGYLHRSHTEWVGKALEVQDLLFVSGHFVEPIHTNSSPLIIQIAQLPFQRLRVFGPAEAQNAQTSESASIRFSVACCEVKDRTEG